MKVTGAILFKFFSETPFGGDGWTLSEPSDDFDHPLYDAANGQHPQMLFDLRDWMLLSETDVSSVTVGGKVVRISDGEISLSRAMKAFLSETQVASVSFPNAGEKQKFLAVVAQHPEWKVL